MRRRRFLATVGAAGVAGCSGLGEEPKTPGETLTPAPLPSETPVATPDPFGGGRLASAAIGESAVGDRTFALTPAQYTTDENRTVAVRFDRAATEDHPARLTAFLRPRDDTDQDLSLRSPPFLPTPRFGLEADSPTEITAEDRGTDIPAPSHLYLAPAPTSAQPAGASKTLAREPPAVESVPGGDGPFWRLAQPAEQWLSESIRLAAGETLQLRFRLVAPSSATRAPLGPYRADGGDTVGVRLAVWQTSAPGPTASSRFGGRGVPSLPDATARWFHRADAKTPVFLRPRSERVETPGFLVATLVNHSRGAVGASGWELYKLVDGSWYGLGPYVSGMAGRPLPPGDAHTWRLAVATDGDHPSGGFETADGRFDYLGGGRYALAGGGSERGQPAALFQLVASSVAVEPTADVRTGRDDRTVTVRTERPSRDGDVEPAVLVLERADAPSTPDGSTPTPQPTFVDQTGRERPGRLIPEQVMRSRGLRNSLPFFGTDVDTVRVETDEAVAARATTTVRYGATPGRLRFRFDGTTYRIGTEAVAAPGDGTDGTPTWTPVATE